MSGHSHRLLGSIDRSCAQYLSGGTVLAELQAAVEPVVAALEVQDERLESALRRFVTRLEAIRFLVDEPEQPREVAREIESLREEMSSYRAT